MSKRFVDTGKYRQAWRKLDPKLRAAFYWLTENCDAAGYWTVDLDHFKFECGYALDIERLIRETQAVEWHGKKVLRLIDFIETNYGTLKEGYNPHKPALRALAHHQVSSLNQASTKLEDEEEDEEEDTQIKERAHEAKVIPMPFTSEAFAIAWAEWETSRREAGKPIKPTGRKLQMAKCIEWGEIRAIAALRHSAANGYQGLFEPNTQRNGPVAKTQSERDAELAAIVAARYATQ